MKATVANGHRSQGVVSTTPFNSECLKGNSEGMELKEHAPIDMRQSMAVWRYELRSLNVSGYDVTKQWVRSANSAHKPVVVRRRSCRH